MWELSWRTDPRGRELADRHYSRQSIGAKGFVQSGSCLVLVYTHEDNSRALWVTVNPESQYVLHRWAGAWQCSIFRNETPILSSTLIREAVACTRWYYGPVPELGMITFVDTSKIRHKRDPGRCFLKAGFTYLYEEDGTLSHPVSDKNKVVLHLSEENMAQPLIPNTIHTPYKTLLNALEKQLERVGKLP